MKTNVVMIRKMGDFTVNQRTKDGMFNATILIKQWNKYSNDKKYLYHYFENKSTQEYISKIQNDPEFLHTRNSVYVKSRASRGDNAGTWMHPYLFIDFAMWLNVSFKLEVIKFVHDQLIEFRHLAGDNYKVLSASGSRLNGYDYVKVAKAMQWIVFNKTGKELRQLATREQLQEISDIEKKLAFAVDMGYINSFPQLEEELRKLYRKKYFGDLLTTGNQVYIDRGELQVVN